MRFAQLVIGPAGSGKSTYCSALVQHGIVTNRTIDVVNLDPAAEHFEYDPVVDIRELIHVQDTMEDEDLHFGPNGGLVFCVEYLLENADWLRDKLGEQDEDYVLFDCPGQIELYTHYTTVRKLVDAIQSWGFRVVVVFLLDAQFIIDAARFISGTLTALTTMLNLELPHVNLLSKCDLLGKRARRKLADYLQPDCDVVMEAFDDAHPKFNAKYRKLTEAIGRLVEDHPMVQFIPLNLKDEENLGDVLITIDNVLQYGEDLDVKTKDFEENDAADDE